MPRVSPRVVGEDAHWLILTCASCFGLFDVPKGRGRPPGKCPDCRPSQAERCKAYRLRVTV